MRLIWLPIIALTAIPANAAIRPINPDSAISTEKAKDEVKPPKPCKVLGMFMKLPDGRMLLMGAVKVCTP